MRNAAVRSLGQWFLLLAGTMIGLATVQTAAAIPPVDIGTPRDVRGPFSNRFDEEHPSGVGSSRTA